MKRALLVAAFLSCAPRLGAQPSDLLTDVRALYESAAYEEVLVRLADVDPSARTAPIEQYRAFCLIALGRMDQAATAIEHAVDADPDFVPSPSDASPRMRALFEETRRKLLPAVIRRTYASAKSSFSAGDFSAAHAGFTRVVKLAASLGSDASPELADLRLVAQEFVDLSGQRLAVKASSDAANAAARAAAPAIETKPAVPLNQTLPQWTRREGMQLVLTGAVLVAIDETGKVVSARTTRISDPTYDRLVVEAARSWRYTPAMRNGKPLPSERTITYVLKPR